MLAEIKHYCLALLAISRYGHRYEQLISMGTAFSNVASKANLLLLTDLAQC